VTRRPRRPAPGRRLCAATATRRSAPAPDAVRTGPGRWPRRWHPAIVEMHNQACLAPTPPLGSRHKADSDRVWALHTWAMRRLPAVLAKLVVERRLGEHISKVAQGCETHAQNHFQGVAFGEAGSRKAW
jgi:hypothetical protein